MNVVAILDFFSSKSSSSDRCGCARFLGAAEESENPRNSVHRNSYAEAWSVSLSGLDVSIRCTDS